MDNDKGLETTDLNQINHIKNSYELENFCKRAGSVDILYVDTEFVREETYWPQLEVVQVNYGTDETAVIDLQAVREHSSLWELLYRPDVLKVFHAASQDLEMLHLQTEQFLTNIFDTQVAAAFLGIGDQVGYGQLVRMVTGNEISKAHAYSPWSDRPLTQQQITYAALDVEYLPAIHTVLSDELASRGRLNWAREEFAEMESFPNFTDTKPDDLYLRVKGSDNLSRKELSILRELAIWREDEARAHNQPIRKILRDESMIQIARFAPKTQKELRALRGFPTRAGDMYGPEILRAVQRGLEVPKDQWPDKIQGRVIEHDLTATISLLQIFLKIKALEMGIAPGLLSNGGELERLVSPDFDSRELRVMNGWRYEMIGKDLERLLNGDLTLSIDPITKRACLIGQDEPAPITE